MDELHSQSGVSSTAELDQTLREVARLEQQLHELRQELVWSNRLTTLGTMSAVLAHEYNNLLTPIGSYAQLALANPEDAELTQKALEAAVQGVAQARAVAEATLDFARPNDAEEPAHTAIREVVERSLMCLGQPLAYDEVQLETDLPDVELAIPAMRLQQVLVNLIDNARKALAGQRPPRRLELKGRVQDRGLIIEVTDDGPGIPSDIIQRVFEPFVTQAPHGQSCKGTGLGLRICKDLIESAGGWIQAESQLSQGTTMRFWLPLA